ncbi:Insect cuticle protein [Trinorchestia longiramus]|nr:Insect cuticle protein [Trinorchestia longiramus]
MRTHVLILVAVVAGANGGQLYASAPLDRGQYHTSQLGSYNYGYNTGDGVAKVEVKRKDGSVVGSYRYFDPNGKQIVRSYVADSKGFRILGNDLPISPETPAAAIVGAPALTAAVEGAADAVVESSVDATKRFNTVDIERINAEPLLKHYYQQRSVFEQQNELLRQQQRLIEEQKRQLDSYRSGYEDTSASGPSVQEAPSEVMSFNAIDNTGQDDYPSYYYYPHNYNYDFPAGFAFEGGLVPVRPRSVIGVKRHNFQETLTAGRTQGERSFARPPLHVVPRSVRPYRPPFVAGRI